MAIKKATKVYHHTPYGNLQKIITSKGICFRGSYYERFSADDYEWTKQHVSSIIKETCENKDYPYTEDSSFKPIIISFGQEPKSGYMWEHYADNYQGVQLVLDYEVIRDYADNRLDYFDKCEYLEEDDFPKIKSYLRTNELRIEDVDDYQSNLEALSCLIKRTEFRRETEIRYVHPYSQMFSVNYKEFQEKGDEAFHELTPELNDEDCYVCLPKEALLGVTIGYKSQDKLDEVKHLLQAYGFDIAKVEILIQEAEECR